MLHPLPCHTPLQVLRGRGLTEHLVFGRGADSRDAPSAVSMRNLGGIQTAVGYNPKQSTRGGKPHALVSFDLAKLILTLTLTLTAHHSPLTFHPHPHQAPLTVLADTLVVEWSHRRTSLLAQVCSLVITPTILHAR